MRRDRWPWRAAAVMAVVVLLAGCGRSGTDDPTTPAASTSTPTPSVPSEPTATATPRKTKKPEPTVTPPRGLVYYAGRRARTEEWLLFAEQTELRGRTDLLSAVRAAMGGTAVDPDYTSLWGGEVVDQVKLLWDGDEGYYSVRLLDRRATRRPPGMSMREAHLAIQQVVWTLSSVGRVPAPVRFRVGRSQEPVTDLLGVPATGPSDTYLAADYRGVLSSMNTLAPADGSTVDGVLEISGLAESFEATVGIQVHDAGGERVVDDSTQAEECCGRLFPWTYAVDVSEWPPGVYTISALTDDAVGIEQGSDGPEIDTKTITVQ